MALGEGLLLDKALEHWRRLEEARAAFRAQDDRWGAEEEGIVNTGDPSAYCKRLAETLPSMRNEYAHGSGSIIWMINMPFELCRDMIDRLFSSLALPEE